MPKLNLDELVIIIRKCNDGYVTHYFLFDNRGPVQAVIQTERILNDAINGGSDAEELRISVDKAALKTEIGGAIDTRLD